MIRFALGVLAGVLGLLVWDATGRWPVARRGPYYTAIKNRSRRAAATHCDACSVPFTPGQIVRLTACGHRLCLTCQHRHPCPACRQQTA